MASVRRRKAASDGDDDHGREEVINRHRPDTAIQETAAPSGARRWLRRIFASISFVCAVYLFINYDSFSGQHESQVESKETLAAMKIRQPSLPFSIPRHEVPATIVRSADQDKRDAIKDAFMNSWHSYVDKAFGADEFNSLTGTSTNFSSSGGVGYFIIDVIDMLLILGERTEYERARDWIRDLTWYDKTGKFSVFETTIRTLGGLLSAHALCTADPRNTLSMRTSTVCGPTDANLFLTKALELAEALSPAFEANTFGLPEREIDFSTGQLYADVDNSRLISLAEATTVQLELKYLAYLTDDQRWWRMAERPMETVRNAAQKMRFDGLMPIFLNPATGLPSMSDVRLGSRGDSYYEYLIKQYVQTNRTELVYLDMYQQAMMGVKSRLLRQSPVRKMLHTTELHIRMDPKTRRQVLHLVGKQDHLVCFIGGSFMLGALHVQPGLQFEPLLSMDYPPTKQTVQRWNALANEDWDVGHGLTKACVETYTDTRTGLSPEIAMFRLTQEDGHVGYEQDWYIKQPKKPSDGRKPDPLLDARNILRPETVESLFIGFHLSGDQQYREWGWQIFQSFQRHCRVSYDDGASYAFAGIKDVDAEASDVQQIDRMETFWLAETLKYLYLLFADQDILRMDQWVFNTEAHPLPVFTPTMDTMLA